MSAADNRSPATPMLPADVAEALERTRARRGNFGERLVYLVETDSTNDVAASLAVGGAAEGTVVTAETQRSGRGRLGREWYSPPGAGLYVSVVLRPPRRLGDRHRAGAAPGFSAVTLVAGVALAEALRVASGLPIEIKWPNDLVVARRKLCGILAEAAAADGAVSHVILGYGVNLRAAAYPPELVGRATSIEAELGRPIGRGEVLAETLASLAERYAQFCAGRVDDILRDWRRLAPSSVGTSVKWTGATGPAEGVTEGIDADGALVVRTSRGLERVVAGEVQWGRDAESGSGSDDPGDRRRVEDRGGTCC